MTAGHLETILQRIYFRNGKMRRRMKWVLVFISGARERLPLFTKPLCELQLSGIEIRREIPMDDLMKIPGDRKIKEYHFQANRTQDLQI